MVAFRALSIGPLRQVRSFPSTSGIAMTTWSFVPIVLPLPNEELNLSGALRWPLARDAREPHLIQSAGRLTPAR